MKFFVFSILIVAGLPINCIAQTQNKPSKFFLSVGCGGAGSFFVRSYDEDLPSSTLGYKAFLKKNFIGVAQEIAIGVHLKRNVDIKFGYNRQRFTRHIHVNDTLSDVGLIIDHQIQHIDHNWFIGVCKNYIRSKNQLSWEAGLYYWTGQLHTVEIYPRYIIDQEAAMKGSYSGDLGAYVQLGYEYQFQPKVNLGIKSQFFWIVSGSYASSVALFPFIKLNF